MSKDIIVLTPTGRRQKIHCTADTSILQILEEVCTKQGFQPADYDLKHHKKILDLTTTIRFSNLPNKALLEMVDVEKKRQESDVTVGLLLEDGERRTANFPPTTSLYDIIISLAPMEFNSLHNPTILYMRQEVTGEAALKAKTLRQLGLLGGRAILRLLNKAEEAMQANVSKVYSRPQNDIPQTKESSNVKAKDDNIAESNMDSEETSLPGPSTNTRKVDYKIFDPIKMIKQEKSHNKEEKYKDENIAKSIPQDLPSHLPPASPYDQISNKAISAQIEQSDIAKKSDSTLGTSQRTQVDLERRLNIEDEVTFLGAQKAIAFMQPENIEEELEDLPDDFYELTIAEVRKLYKDLQQHRLDLENSPLITSSKREELEKQTSEQKIISYKNVVVRIQFPDRMILQGIFSPDNTIEDVTNFVKEHVQYPDKPFHIFTTPLKEILDPKLTLLEAKFVPCVHMHFKWLQEEIGQIYLKEEIYSKKTSSDAASILASKYRAPSRRKITDQSTNSTKQGVESSSTSKNSKVPKWFKK